MFNKNFINPFTGIMNEDDKSFGKWYFLLYNNYSQILINSV